MENSERSALAFLIMRILALGRNPDQEGYINEIKSDAVMTALRFDLDTPLVKTVLNWPHCPVCGRKRHFMDGRVFNVTMACPKGHPPLTIDVLELTNVPKTGVL